MRRTSAAWGLTSRSRTGWHATDLVIGLGLRAEMVSGPMSAEPALRSHQSGVRQTVMRKFGEFPAFTDERIGLPPDRRHPPVRYHGPMKLGPAGIGGESGPSARTMRSIPPGSLSTVTVPMDHIRAILQAMIDVPPNACFQPWRFLVVRDAARLAGLRHAVPKSRSLRGCSVAIAVFTPLGSWEQSASAVMAAAGCRPPYRLDVARLLPASSWLSRRIEQVCACMTVAAGALGWSAEAVTGFSPELVRRQLGLLPDMEVVGLVVFGGLRVAAKAETGRWEDLAYAESLSRPWSAAAAGDPWSREAAPAGLANGTGP